MDIVIMDKFGRTNGGHLYILLLIDVFTRKGYAIPMKTKSIKDTANALTLFCHKYFIPEIINCDNDTSFLGKEFKKVIDENGIVLIENDVGDHNALGIIDRFVQTIKNKIYKYFKTKNTTNWVSSLGNVINSYNNTVF
jgi:transposase InsO family protein